MLSLEPEFDPDRQYERQVQEEAYREYVEQTLAERYEQETSEMIAEMFYTADENERDSLDAAVEAGYYDDVLYPEQHFQEWPQQNWDDVAP